MTELKMDEYCPECPDGLLVDNTCDRCGYSPGEDKAPQFEPTEEQAEAIQSVTEWYEDEKLTGFSEAPFYVISGYAGTGKSYSITIFAKQGPIKPSRIVFTAPTNKAVKVLRNYLDENGLREYASKTIFSLLGLSLQANGEVKELAKPEEPVDLSVYDLIVVDEASMVNRFLMDSIRDAVQDWHKPFLFMGDPAQLPPVGEITSPVWAIQNQSLLTQVMRYGDSMLDLATSIRKVVDSPFPSVKIETNPPVYRLTKPEWLDKAVENLELFKNGEAKMIAWRNVKVDEYNQFLRGHIFGRREARSNRWLPGDKIVSTGHLKNLDDNVFMRTDEEATIEDITIGLHPYYREYEIFNLKVLLENGRKETLRVLTPDGQHMHNNELETVANEARGGKKYRWRYFWELKEAFHTIKHSYSITSHRSQGSSYRKVWVDLEDIMLNRNRQEAFRSLYVCCTRQREELNVS